VKPVCGSCKKHDTVCVYDSPQSTPPAAGGSGHITPQPEQQHEGPSVIPEASVAGLKFQSLNINIEKLFDSSTETGNLSETKERRLLELRLLHNFLEHITQPFKLPQAGEVVSAWSQDVPKLALRHENLLYAVMSISATNLLRSDPNDSILLAARENYLVLALGAQRRAVDNLTDEVVDAATFTSLLILINSFAMLHERSHQPYVAPMPWLEMGKGAGSIINFLLTANKSTHATRVDKVVRSVPYIWDDPTVPSEPNRIDFMGVLTQSLASDDNWDDETRMAYEVTLSYIGSLNKSIKDGEPPFAICKRVICFPMYIPLRFIDFVQEQRPRALVVLAHYFAVVAQVKMPLVWWIGDAPPREIKGIQTVLPQEWQGQMMWPLAMATS